MKFACPKCKTRYNVADDKVPPARTLRFPCKKCGNVIRLRRKTATPKPAPSMPAPSSDAQSTRVASLSELDKLRNEAAGEAPVPKKIQNDFNAATRIASLDDINRALDAASPKDQQPALDETKEWFVLVGGKQQGPFPAGNVVAKLQRKEIDKRTYVWCEGMGDWKRLGTLPELENLAAHTGDAAWRVMTPMEESAQGSFDSHQPTVAMDSRQLHEQLDRVRKDGSSSTKGPLPMVDESSVDGSKTTIMVSDQMIVEDVETQVAAELAEPHSFEMPPTQAAAPEIRSGASEASEPTDAFDEPDAALKQDFDDDDEEELRTALGESGGIDDFGPVDTFDAPLGAPLDDVPEDLGTPRATEEPSNPFAGLSSQAVDPGPPIGSSEEYFNAPPGESTRVFMATAGIYRRRQRHRIAAAVGILVCAILVGFVSLDILGILEIPGMGMFYEKTGLLDPNIDRAVARVEEKLNEGNLDPDRRASLEKMRRRLLGAAPGPQAPAGGPSHTRRQKTADGAPGGQSVTEGVTETHDMSDRKRSMVEDLFADDRKRETKIMLEAPESVQAPNLPSGLTQEAITGVIAENNRSMNLCLTEALRKGEQLTGRMDIEMTIAPDGSVPEVKIDPAKFRNTVMAGCTIKRIKGWKFPRFNGEPVTVSYPYVLQMGF